MRFVLILVIFSLFLTSCALVDFGEGVGSKIGKQLLPDEVDDAKQRTCEARAQSFIPNEVVLVNTSTWFLKSVTWNDGSVQDVSIRYRTGEETGEKLNYYYPDNVLESDYISYSQTLISEDGVILGDREFAVKLILEPLDDTLEIITDSVYDRDISQQRFVVVESTFRNCEWVSDS